LSVLHGAATARAQAPTPPGAGGSDAVLSYAIVIICIGVGVYVVSRSTNRADAERPEYFSGPVAKGMRGEEFHEQD
jgi:hypothetical protein